MEATNKYEVLKQAYTLSMQSCELCLSEELSSFQKYGRVGAPGEYGDLHITICKNCGYKMQNPRYPDAFYEAYYYHLYREVAFGDLKPSDTYIAEQNVRGDGVRRWFSQHVKNQGKMLDHGCASGGTMLSWMENGWKCMGLDPHKPSVDAGIEMGFDITVGAGESMPFDDHSFDLVLSLGSLEHTYNLGKSLHEIHRSLRPGGHLLIRWRSNVVFGSPLEYFNHNHYRFFTPNTLKLALHQYGFDPIYTTDEKLEGWDSYSYLLAVKNQSANRPSIKDMLADGFGDEYQSELDSISKTRTDYYHRCKAHILSADSFHKTESKDYKLEDLRRHFENTQLGFLGGDVETSLSRSLMEANRYVEEFDSGLVK